MAKAIMPRCVGVAAFVASCGGLTRLTRALGHKHVTTVRGWVVANKIPRWRIPEIIAAAARLDPPVHLTPNDFFDVPPVVGSSPTSGVPPAHLEPTQAVL